MSKDYILDYELDDLEKLMISMDEAGFRAKQIFSWLYKGIDSFDEMINIPKKLRKKLSDVFDVRQIKPIRVQTSKLDGTRKYLFQLEDGNAIESVFMKYKYGNSICVSSQAGCRMGCRFCASTMDGLARNLSAGEIVSQILQAERDTGERISHVVVMGTGEPFDNYENVAKFIRIINSKEALNIGMRNITVSTCGIVPIIDAFGRDFPQVNLAISLHAATDEKRSELMPVNKAYPLDILIDACKKYVKDTSRRITFEYTLVSGQNDSISDAKTLANLLKGILCHVNLIPLNVVRERKYDSSNKETVYAFQRTLEERGIPVTIRRELGDDIDGACGQLRLKSKDADKAE